MLRLVVSLCLLGGTLAQTETELVPLAGVVLSFVSSATTNGTAEIRWTINGTNDVITATKYVGIGFQTNVPANASSGEVSMFGPIGGGSDFFIMRGAVASATGEFRNLKNSDKPSPTSRGRTPTALQSLMVGGTPNSPSDRVRSVTAGVVNNITTYTMTVWCAPGTQGSADLSQPVVVLFAVGSVDGGGNIQRHSSSEPGRGWRRQEQGAFRLFRLCGPNSGYLNAPATSGPSAAPTTTSASAMPSSIAFLFLVFSVLALLFF